MSVHSKTTPAGARRYVVRWREGDRNRSRAFSRKRDAEAFDAEVDRRRQLGPLAVTLLDAGGESLDTYVGKTWGPAHLATVAPKTQEKYAGTYDRHVGPRLGSRPLREIGTDAVRTWQADLQRAGVGPHAIRTAMMVLSMILQAAVEAERIAVNPVPRVKKVKTQKAREVEPLEPAAVEGVRRHMLARGDLRDATLISVLAYAGLRPGEALALRWDDVRDATLRITRAVALGDVKDTKTGKSRSVALLAPLRQDLAEWRMASGRPAKFALIFPAAEGRPWGESAWKNWRRRQFLAATRAAGIDKDPRPYDLRHSLASLLLFEGRDGVYVADQIGNDPAVTYSTYAHVMKDLNARGSSWERVSAEAAIRAARGDDVPSQFPQAV